MRLIAGGSYRFRVERNTDLLPRKREIIPYWNDYTFPLRKPEPCA